MFYSLLMVRTGPLLQGMRPLKWTIRAMFPRKIDLLLDIRTMAIYQDIFFSPLFGWENTIEFAIYWKSNTESGVTKGCSKQQN